MLSYHTFQPRPFHVRKTSLISLFVKVLLRIRSFQELQGIIICLQICKDFSFNDSRILIRVIRGDMFLGIYLRISFDILPKF